MNGMGERKTRALACIDAYANRIAAVSDAVWACAELSLCERRSAACFEEALTEAGFAVETGICGVETAFCASFGSGAPVIGLLAEYDALSGLSQKGCATAPEPEPGMENGHGCGHNLLGAGSFGAALAVKSFLEQSGLPGTVRLYGCPGEEGGAAKAFMAKQGLWKQLDAALTWHPDDSCRVVTGSCMACIQKEYAFSGVAAHAAGDPHHGRSALDAVTLMNTGVQFLREHMPRSASVHYAILDAGGVSPNVVQQSARVLYMIRDDTVPMARALETRVDDIARGAALMTGTSVRTRFIDGCSDTVPNFALEKLLYENYRMLGVPDYSRQELAFAAQIRQTWQQCDPALLESDPEVAERVSALSRGGEKPINDFLNPLSHDARHRPGSTDVGDVSHLTPTAQINAATFPSGCPGHSWQAVSCAASPMALRATLHAAKVLAATAIDLIAEPALLVPAQTEFERRTAAGFESPIPDGAVPVTV